MNLDELRPILAAYRAQVEPAWSPATAHPNYDGKAGDPAGQCGVTSAWLQRRLREDHGIETTYCVGDVHQGFTKSLRDHCWLEVGPDRYVVDLTIDQAWPRVEFVGRHWDLQQAGLDYQAHRWLTPEALLADKVQPRLALLTEALS